MDPDVAGLDPDPDGVVRPNYPLGDHYQAEILQPLRRQALDGEVWEMPYEEAQRYFDGISLNGLFLLCPKCIAIVYKRHVQKTCIDVLGGSSYSHTFSALNL